MTPGKYNILCPQGATFAKQLTYRIDGDPVDLTGYTARMQVRENHASKNIVVDINTQNSGITLGGEEGTIDLFINDQDTELIFPKKYVYDLEIASSSEVYRILEGNFIVTPEVTR
jgi:hypothetical protein